MNVTVSVSEMPLSDAPVALLFSLRREMRTILRGRALSPEPAASDLTVWRISIGGKEALAAFTGIGGERAASAVRKLAEQRRLRSIVSCGFAGALWEELRAGDVVVASEIADARLLATGESDSTPKANLVSLALTASVTTRLPVTRAGILSVDRVVKTAKEKRSLLQRAPYAAAVDMESAAVVQAARRAGIPCACIRGISDTAREGVPAALTRGLDPATGDPHPLPLALALLASPGAIPALFRLGRGASLAARNLGSFVEAYVASLADATPATGDQIPGGETAGSH